MWKTRFEVSTGNSSGLSRHRTLSSSSTILHHYYSRRSPTVPRVREDSPSAIVRPSPPSSIPNLESLMEEENEDIPCSIGTNNEQPSLISITLRKKNSYQAINRHQIVLPTIVESNDHEVMIDDIPNKSDENVFNSELINDDGQNKYVVTLKPQDSRVATNTNYTQVTNIDIERKERVLNGNKNSEITGFRLDKRINELLQQKSERQNKSTSSLSDVDKIEMLTPTTFKDISAFFENKVLAANTAKISEQKKMIRAKRSLSLNRYMPVNNYDLPQLEIISSTDEESTMFQHQIKRLKKSEFSQISEPEFMIRENITERSIKFDINAETMEHEVRSEPLPIVMNNKPLKKSLSNRWFIILILITTLLVYFYLSNVIVAYHDFFSSTWIVYLQNYAGYFFPRRNKEPIRSINSNIIFRYGQFVRNRFFSLFDLIILSIGQILFRIDKYEYKNNITYVATSTYEHLYDWFMHLFKKQ